jgi:hypothetical protein
MLDPFHSHCPNIPKPTTFVEWLANREPSSKNYSSLKWLTIYLLPTRILMPLIFLLSPTQLQPNCNYLQDHHNLRHLSCIHHLKTPSRSNFVTTNWNSPNPEQHLFCNLLTKQHHKNFTHMHEPLLLYKIWSTKHNFHHPTMSMEALLFYNASS